MANLSIRTCQCLIPGLVAVFDVVPGTAGRLGNDVTHGRPQSSEVIKSLSHQRPLHDICILLVVSKFLEFDWEGSFLETFRKNLTRNEGPRVLRHGDTGIPQSDSVDELLSLEFNQAKYQLKETQVPLERGQYKLNLQNKKT